jgi:hypothetical protein
MRQLVLLKSDELMAINERVVVKARVLIGPDSSLRWTQLLAYINPEIDL